MVQPLEPVEEGDWPFSYGRRWKWAADTAGEQREADLVCAQFGLKELTAQAYNTVLQQGGPGWLKPRLFTLAVWVGDVADGAAYEENIAAEITAWEEEEKAARAETGTAATGTVAPLKSGGGGPCTTTNDAQPFVGTRITPDANGGITGTWESCTNYA